MKKATIVCVIVMVLIFIAIIVTCSQVSLLLNHTSHNGAGKCPRVQMKHVISLSARDFDNTMPIAERFPYVAAITRNSSTLWPFACFASVVLVKWIVTSAHCRRPGSSHRVILYHDFVHNQTYAFPILFWRLHEKFNISSPTPKYDIAVAKLNIEYYPFTLKPAVFDQTEATEVEASIWKTVSTMDRKLYLTNHFDKYDLKIANAGRCFESYGVEIDESMMCVDMSDHEDCFIHEFGPIFTGDKLVGIVAVKPQDCDMKLSIFTNISFYTNWILRTTHEG